MTLDITDEEAQTLRRALLIVQHTAGLGRPDWRISQGLLERLRQPPPKTETESQTNATGGPK